MTLFAKNQVIKYMIRFLLILFSINTIYAASQIKDLGVFGTVFPVIEKNIMQVLMEKLQSEQGRQVLSDFETSLKTMRDKAEFVPQPVAGLTSTVEPKSYLFNPGLSLNHDLTDHEGTRFYKKGDVVNPLDHMTLSKDYLFIDGNRSKQVAWAKAQQHSKHVMIVLVSGDPMKIMKDHDMQVFFDQEGAMVKRFQLTHVPCVIRQEDKMLRILEIPEEELMS